MSVEFYRESPGKFDSKTLARKTLNRWTGRTCARLFQGRFGSRQFVYIVSKSQFKIHQRGVQWKQGVVVYILS